MVNKTILSLAIASALAVSGCATRINMDKLSGDMLAQHAAGSPKMETSRGDDSLINSSNSLDDFLTDGYNKKFHAIRVADDDSQEVCKCNAEKGLNEGINLEIRGFASMKKILRKGKIGRKVKTGEVVVFGDYYNIKLKISKGFKQQLNEK